MSPGIHPEVTNVSGPPGPAPSIVEYKGGRVGLLSRRRHRPLPVFPSEGPRILENEFRSQ